MSELESIIWHVLGYAAMPVIFIAGFCAVFLAAVAIVKVSGDSPVED